MRANLDVQSTVFWTKYEDSDVQKTVFSWDCVDYESKE